MEDLKQIPEEYNSTDSSSEIRQESKNKENAKEFNEFLENTGNQEVNEEKANSDFKREKQETKNNSIFKKFLNYGFDGISSNPNYKLLALLIILLINLSLFFVIGNIGKVFLRKAGIM